MRSHLLNALLATSVCPVASLAVSPDVQAEPDSELLQVDTNGI